LTKRGFGTRDHGQDLPQVGDHGTYWDYRHAQLRLEGQRGTSYERQPNIFPVLSREILDNAPGLEVGFPRAMHDQSIRGAPDRAFGDVADL
jgi:hypothetical protein